MAWTDAQKAEITRHLAAMIVSLGGEGDPALFLGYTIGLDGLTVDQVKRACARAIRTSKFLPKPVELRELSGEVSLDHRVTLAWEAVKTAIERVGGYRSVDFDDKAVNAAIHSLGGWPHVCEQTTIAIDRDLWPRFQRVYKAFAARGSISAADASPALGIFASENTLRGHEVQPPVKVDTGLGNTLAISSERSQSKPALPPAALRIGVIDAT